MDGKIQNPKVKYILFIILGGLLGLGLGITVTAALPTQYFTVSAEGVYDYVELYNYNGDNSTVERRVVVIVADLGEARFSKQLYDVYPSNLQVQVFIDGSKSIGYIMSDLERDTSVNVNGVLINLQFVITYDFEGSDLYVITAFFLIFCFGSVLARMDKYVADCNDGD